jgi:hypothetical protein
MKEYTRTYVRNGDIIPRTTKESLEDLKWRANALVNGLERFKDHVLLGLSAAGKEEGERRMMERWRDGGMEGWRDGGMRDGGMRWRDEMEGWRDGGMEG